MTDFEKPFDAPAILVVGHQTDGKSALVEALMVGEPPHAILQELITCRLLTARLPEGCNRAGG
jgi:hypothetical protein